MPHGKNSDLVGAGGVLDVIARSPTTTELVKNFRRWPNTTGFHRCPRCRQGFMESSALIVGEIVPFIRDKVDNRPVG
jgi:hypothetical protein